ncbi:SH3 domain-containing protein [Wenjunlia tyrosinilytica]|uniref:SH3b domain-containing protein n=1 Tax=Wenjunlia tyrosinilytica TaxID=1544741 RepID=A0A918DVJ5_9ACTN|nr:SH3 domain-containing protein [Wenjunlia tyrosinilytica]GGO85204.1 hypothetical protein GCM10012280_18450 [Wenjunlia tyrosinilytica]
MHISSWKNLKTAAAVGAVGAVALGVLGAAPAVAGPHDDGPQSSNSTSTGNQQGQSQQGQGQQSQQGQQGRQDERREDNRRDREILGRVVARSGVNIRSTPSTKGRVLGSFRSGALIKIECKVIGESVLGNNRWYKLDDRPGFVAARWVQNLSPVPWCR